MWLPLHEMQESKTRELRFIADDGFDDMHHTCLSCNTHFSHADGEIFVTCERCNYLAG